MRFLIIGDISGRRVNSFVDCLRHKQISDYQVLSWRDLLRNIAGIGNHLTMDTIIRVEPPEKDMEIYREFLRWGAEDGELTQQDIDKLDFSRNPIIAPRQWYKGFTTFLAVLYQTVQPHFYKRILFMNDFAEAAVMMDKEATYDRLAGGKPANLFSLPAKLKSPDNYQQLREFYGNNFLRCFIKLRYGSGGTGIIAYSHNPKVRQEIIYTSLQVDKCNRQKSFYSGNKVNCFRDRAIIQELIDWVLANGAHIEQWIPKTTYKGYAFDTRVFVIKKTAGYLVSRLSKGPITNLHLRNKRMESADIMAPECLTVIEKAAEAVMQIFNETLYAGIDVVCCSRLKPYIIDVNPFGDLFHHLLGTHRNVHYLAIQAALEGLQGIRNEY